MNKKNTTTIIILILLATGVYFAWGRSDDVSKTNETGATKKVKTITVGAPEENADFIKREGVVKGQKEIYLAPKAEGRVQRIYKEIGERVYRGQLLAYIDGQEYWAQSKVAQTGYEFADKTVSKTKKFFEAQIEQAKEARDLAEEAYEDYKKMGDKEKAAEAKADYEMAKKAVDTAKRGYDLQVKMAKGQRDLAKSQWEAANIVAVNTRLTAPFNGVIAQTLVDEGDLVEPERPMFLLVDDSKKEVEISVEGRYLTQIKIGDEIKVVNKDGEEILAKVKAVSPMVDTHSRKGVVKLSLPQNDNFKIGEYVDVYLPQPKELVEEILIPQTALVRVYHDNFVFVDKDGKAERRKVKVGEIVGDKIVIKDGLQAGDKVIVEGQQYLGANDELSIIND